MIILIDSNELKPLEFKIRKKQAETEVKKLYLGNTRFSQDYSIKDFESEIGVEFKRLGDFYSSAGTNHKKFFQKLEAFKDNVLNPYLVISANIQNLLRSCSNNCKVGIQDRAYRVISNVKVESVVGSLIAIAEMGIKVRFYKNDQEAGREIYKLFKQFIDWKNIAQK